MDQKEAMQKLKEKFGDGSGLLAQQILMLSMSGQPCDVTFFKKPPALDVTIDHQISLALMYGAGAKKLQEMLFLRRYFILKLSTTERNQSRTLTPMRVERYHKIRHRSSRVHHLD